MLINELTNIPRVVQKKSIKYLQIVQGTEQDFINYMLKHHIALYYFNVYPSHVQGGLFVYDKINDNILYIGYSSLPDYNNEELIIATFTPQQDGTYIWQFKPFSPITITIEGYGDITFTYDTLAPFLMSNTIPQIIANLPQPQQITSFSVSSSAFESTLLSVLSRTSLENLSELKSFTTSLIPELLLGENLDQELPQHHIYNVLDHILVSTLNAYKLNAPTEVIVTMLLHDIGKPLVKARMFSERTTFFSHEKASVALADKILPRLGYDGDKIFYIKSLIELHERRNPTAKTWKKHISLYGEEFCNNLFLVFESDILAQAELYRGEKLEEVNLSRERFKNVLSSEIK